MKSRILFVAFGILLFSCAPKIDASSEESMEQSLKDIKTSLTEEKQEEFAEAIKLIAFEGFDLAEMMKEGGAEKVSGDMMSKLDGLSADEVIAKGEAIKAEIERKKKEQAGLEIEELYAKQELAAKHREKLEQFEVKRSRFYKRKTGEYYVTEEPIIELTVFNGTEHAISRAYFDGTLASPDRSVPWLEKEFNYEISGGLEPGEETTWHLAPNMFSEWGKVDAPKDAILTVEVTGIDGPTGEELYSVDNFDDSDLERLQELVEDNPEFAR